VQQERHLAEVTATEDALEALPRLAADLGTDDPVVQCTRHELEKRLRVLNAGDGETEDEPALRYDRQYSALRLATVARKRDTLLRLRDEGRIDDVVPRQVQNRLDIEEVRLTRCEEAMDWPGWAGTISRRIQPITYSSQNVEVVSTRDWPPSTTHMRT
jgi:hypothetical protein